MVKTVFIELIEFSAVGAGCICYKSQKIPIVANEPRQMARVRLAIERICGEKRNEFVYLLKLKL